MHPTVNKPADQGRVAGAGRRGIDVLLVEDNPSHAELIQRAVREIAGDDLRLEIAGNGAQALDMLAAEVAPPRLIITDLKMPTMSGFELLRRIRGSDEMRFVPVLILSSSKLPRDVEESYRLGANSYLQRPLNFQSYIELVSNVIAFWLVHNVPAPERVTA